MEEFRINKSGDMQRTDPKVADQSLWRMWRCCRLIGLINIIVASVAAFFVSYQLLTNSIQTLKGYFNLCDDSHDRQRSCVVSIHLIRLLVFIIICCIVIALLLRIIFVNRHLRSINMPTNQEKTFKQWLLYHKFIFLLHVLAFIIITLLEYYYDYSHSDGYAILFAEIYKNKILISMSIILIQLIVVDEFNRSYTIFIATAYSP